MATGMNGIYDEIINKKIPWDEGIKRMIGYIYENPQLFGLQHIDADLKSNIIVKLLERLPIYIANYSSSRAFFSTYMNSIILNLIKSQYREFYRKKAHESSILYYLEKEKQTAAESAADEGYTADTLEDSGTETAEGIYAGYRYRKNASGKLTATHILILALKACYFLTDTQIRRLSEITGYTETEIYEYKRKLEEAMQKRLKRYKEIQYRLNNSYMMKNRCFLQLMTMPPDSALFNKLSKTYGYYTQSWHSKLRLSHSAGRLRPTNDEIADVLHLQAHQIAHALRYVRSIGKQKIL